MSYKGNSAFVSEKNDLACYGRSCYCKPKEQHGDAQHSGLWLDIRARQPRCVGKLAQQVTSGTCPFEHRSDVLETFAMVSLPSLGLMKHESTGPFRFGSMTTDSLAT